MKRLRLSWLVPALLAVLILGWLVVRPQAPEPAVEAPPVREFVRGNSADPESLDPLQARSEPALNILRDLHEGLATLDAGGQVVPGAARSWTISGRAVSTV